MLAIGSEVKQSNRFELVVQIRDNNGLPTGKVKNFVAENPQELELLWNRNSGKIKKKRKKPTPAAKTVREIEEGLKETETLVQKIRHARKLED
jgi:hypothetical protein